MELDEAFGLEDIVKEEFKDSKKVSQRSHLTELCLHTLRMKESLSTD